MSQEKGMRDTGEEMSEGERLEDAVREKTLETSKTEEGQRTRDAGVFRS